MEPNDLSFGNRLKLMIGLLRITQQDFANQLGIKPQILSGYTGARGGSPNFETLKKILTAYPKINPDWLINGIGKPFRPTGDATATTQTGHAVANTGAGATIQVGTLDDCRNQLLATQGEVIRLQGLLLARQA